MPNLKYQLGPRAWRAFFRKCTWKHANNEHELGKKRAREMNCHHSSSYNDSNLGCKTARLSRQSKARTNLALLDVEDQRLLWRECAGVRSWPTAPAGQRQLPGLPTPLIREHGVIEEMRLIALAIRAA
jgi:hypothetical protein